MKEKQSNKMSMEAYPAILDYVWMKNIYLIIAAAVISDDTFFNVIPGPV